MFVPNVPNTFLEKLVTKKNSVNIGNIEDKYISWRNNSTFVRDNRDSISVSHPLYPESSEQKKTENDVEKKLCILNNFNYINADNFELLELTLAACGYQTTLEDVRKLDVDYRRRGLCLKTWLNRGGFGGENCNEKTGVKTGENDGGDFEGENNAGYDNDSQAAVRYPMESGVYLRGCSGRFYRQGKVGGV